MDQDSISSNGERWICNHNELKEEEVGVPKQLKSLLTSPSHREEADLTHLWRNLCAFLQNASP